MNNRLSFWIVLCLSALGVTGAWAQSPAARPPAAGLVLWLDAADASSLSVDAQGRVAQWQDRSEGHHDVSATADEASRPQLAAQAIGGRPAVRFSGGQSLHGPVIRGEPGSVTLFVVSRRAAGPAGTQQVFGSPAITLFEDGDGGAGTSRAVIAEAVRGDIPLGPLALGRSLAGPPHFLRGDIAEVLVYDRAFPSAGDRQAVLDYLRGKWHAAGPVPTGDWVRVGSLGVTPVRVREDLPLSDQTNRGHWVPDRKISDAFTGNALDARRWHLAPTAPGEWAGEPPALFLPSNVAQQGGDLEITFRKGDVPEMAKYRGQGYAGYTGAYARTTTRTGYGYYEVRAKPMNSTGSSAFWFSDTGLKDNQTEIDVFEIGGKAAGFERKYNTCIHVWGTPQDKQHWAFGGIWDAPWKLADDYHVYGFDWEMSALTWYVDGVPVRRAKNTNCYFPMYLILDSESMFNWFGKVNDADLPSTFHVQYLRVWHHPGQPGTRERPRQ